MKRLIFATLFVLWPSVSFAQVGPEVYTLANPISGSQVLGFNSTTSVGITAPLLSRVVRLTCTATCFVNINATGRTVAATKVSGVYLPTNVPALFSVSPGSKVQVIGDSTTGNLHVLELSR